MKKQTLIVALITFFAFCYAILSWASYRTEAIGVGGYDVVAYHTKNAAIQGSVNIFTYHDGTLYFFASEENKKLFTTDAEKYLPQYGGYCAMAMAKGKKHPADPKAFKIVNNKLYLNGYKICVQKEWLQDIPGNIQKADANWRKIKNVDPAKLM